MNMSQQTPDYTIIGAGIVGVSCALYLQREGYSVALIEQTAPGEGASSGNAGSLGTASIPPTGMPGLVWRVPGMLLDPHAPLIIRWHYLATLTPWLLRLLRSSHGTRLKSITDARAALLSRVHQAYDPLLDEAGLKNVKVENGRLFAYENTGAFSNTSAQMRIRQQYGIRMEALTGDQAREMEPALGANVLSALYLPDVHQIANPLRLVQGFARHFVARGGTLISDKVTNFVTSGAGVSALVGSRNTHAVKNVVVAAGAWSRKLAAQLKVNLPMEAERGYNVTIASPSVRLKMPVSLVEHHVGVSPMEDGLRICGMAEFAGIDTAPNYTRADVLMLNARKVIPSLQNDEVSTRWMGPRPSLPDSVPAIGRTKHLQNVLFACGHDHLGLTMGPITGRLISQVAAGKPPEIDLSPYDPDRFS